MTSPRLKNAICAVSLLAINAYITLRLFHVAYTQQMGSIEASFIGLARYILNHFPHLTWFPLWYGGIPFADTYSPLLPFLVAGLAAATGASAGLAYHIVTASLYALGPVALFWMATRLGAGRVRAFAAALGYSLLSPSCWLVSPVRGESGGSFGPARLVDLVPFGEGPHIGSLVFLVLAIGLLHRALEKRTLQSAVWAGLALAATVLCNWIGAVSVSLAIAAYLLGGVAKDGTRAWWRVAAIGIYAYLIAMPWAMPSTIATIRTDAPKLVGFRSSGGPLAFLAISFLVLAWLLRRSGLRPALRFAILLLYATAVMSLGSYWFHADVLPQAYRYHLEMDLAFWLMLAFVPLPAWPARVRFPRWMPGAVAAVIALPLIVYQGRKGHAMERPIRIETTAEYKISRWLGEHLPGRRVFAPGTVSFWMDAFSDTPMLVGADDNGIRNQILWDVNYQVLAGDQPWVALAWLKAFGCDAIVGGDSTSSEVYHPYAHPERLHGLREIWRDGPEVIYEVPRRGSLAHVVRAADLVREAPAAYNPTALMPYLAALDDPAMPDVSFHWQDPATVIMNASLRPEQLLSVQIAWDQGWTATVDGQTRPIRGDRLGQIVVEPRCNGPCTVQIRYTGGFELEFARAACLLALIAGTLCLFWPLVSRLPGRR